MSTTPAQRHARLTAIVTALQTDIDNLTTRITALKAIGSPTAIQTLELGLSRRARFQDLAVLITLGQARDTDITGTDP